MKKFLSKSENDTLKFAEKFAKKLRGGEVLCLLGELGAGKTTFLKGLAQGLGINESITSPTFVLMKKYRVKKRKIKSFYHFDFYRIKDPSAVLDLGFEEILQDDSSIVAIEWADKAETILPKRKIILKFATKGAKKREITII